MNRPPVSAFPSDMFLSKAYSGPSVPGWASRNTYNQSLKPVGLKNPGVNAMKTLSRMPGASETKNSAVTKLAFGGTRRKGRKLSKQRRLTRLLRRRQQSRLPKKAQTSH
jgi:hypothetical protein